MFPGVIPVSAGVYRCLLVCAGMCRCLQVFALTTMELQAACWPRATRYSYSLPGLVFSNATPCLSGITNSIGHPIKSKHPPRPTPSPIVKKPQQVFVGGTPAMSASVDGTELANS